MNDNILIAKTITDCKEAGIKSITKCYYPECKANSINSHILQKNGILSRIATDGHVYDLDLNQFRDPTVQFKRKGLNKVMSFKCFCNKHDTELFKDIENVELDFSQYRTNLLFTIRTAHNELFRKQVNIHMNECLGKKLPEQLDTPHWQKQTEAEKLGVEDLKKLIQTIWTDLDTGRESFVFKHRHMSHFELCLSAFYNYDTTNEMEAYYRKHGKLMERLSDIFVNYFPMDGSSVLMMGYLKIDEAKVKGYVNRFFKESEKRVQRLLTNLLLFQCETWAISECVYLEKAKGLEKEFSNAVAFAIRNYSERTNHDLNIFKSDFRKKFQRMFG